MIVVDEKENLKKLYDFLEKEFENFNKIYKDGGVRFDYIDDTRRKILQKMNQTELWLHAFDEFEKYTNNNNNNNNNNYTYNYNLGEYFHLSLSYTHGLAFNIRYDNGKLGEAYEVFGSYSTIFEIVNNKIRDFLDLYYNGWGFDQLLSRINNFNNYDIYDRDNNEKIIKKYKGIISEEMEKIFTPSGFFLRKRLMEKSYKVLKDERNRKSSNYNWW